MKGLTTGTRQYILDENKQPVPCPDPVKWGEWHSKQIASENCGWQRVGRDIVGDVCVSTVFLGLDHNFGDKGPPVLWETMFFGRNGSPVEVELDDEDFSQLRYRSWENAEEAHKKIVELLKANPVKQDQTPKLEGPDNG